MRLVLLGYEPGRVRAPDCLAVRAGRLVPIEIKDRSKPPSARQLTPAEREGGVRRGGVPIVVVTSVEEAMALQ